MNIFAPSRSFFLIAVLFISFATKPELADARPIEIKKKNAQSFIRIARAGRGQVLCRVRPNRPVTVGIATRIRKGLRVWQSYPELIRAAKNKSYRTRRAKQRAIRRLREAKDFYLQTCVQVTGGAPTPTPTPPVASELTVSPNALDFGSTSSGFSTEVQSVTVTNNSNSAIDLSSDIVGPDSDRFVLLSTSPQSVAAGQSATIEIAFSAEGAGAKQASLEILSSLSSGIRTVAMSGTVTARDVTPAFAELPAITGITGDDTSLPSQMAWGPDGRLYVGATQGHIVAYEFNDDYTVASKQIITALTSLTNPQILGLTFNPNDPPSPVRIYVAHSELYQDSTGNQCPSGPVTYSGMVSVVSGPTFDTATPLVTGLPVSNHDMGVNGIQFDDHGDLFIAVAGVTNAGVPSCMIGGLPESPLSAAILKAETSNSGFNGTIQYVNSSTELPDTDARNGGLVDVAPGPDVNVFATGLRNAFDIVWTTNGLLFSTDNGPGAAFGEASTSATTSAPGPDEEDEVLLVAEGAYFGHPNRNRGREDERENVYHPPTDPHQSGVYAAPLSIIGSSSNGITEYRSRNFNSALYGDLLVKRFSFAGAGDVYALDPTDNGRAVSAVQILNDQFSGVDLVEGPGGAILVSDLRFGEPNNTSALRILSPTETAPPGLHALDIIPWRGPASGGTSFVIGGSGFDGSVSVLIGGQPAQIDSVTATRISGTTPAALEPNAELLDVVVRSGSTASIIPDAFRYLLPPSDGTGVWSSDVALPSAIGSAGAGYGKSVLYVLGSDSATTQRFDVVTGSWDTVAARTVAAAGQQVQVADDLLYVIGGAGAQSQTLTQIYNPETDSWADGAALPFPSGYGASAAIDDRIYYAGGTDGTNVRSEAAMYDPELGTWSSLPALPLPRQEAIGGSDGTYFYVFGGKDAQGNPTNSVQRYNPSTNTWETSDGGTLAALPTAAFGVSSAPYYQDQLYIIGGNPSSPAAVVAYSPQSNTWRSDRDLPTARTGAAAVAANERIYVVGGVSSGSGSTANEIFRR